MKLYIASEVVASVAQAAPGPPQSRCVLCGVVKEAGAQEPEHTRQYVRIPSTARPRIRHAQ